MHATEMHATLTLRASDPDARPVPARFYVTDASGDSVFPETSGHVAMRNDRSWARERHFVAAGPTELRVRPGRVSVVAERGPEFVPQELALELDPGEHRDVDLVIPRWIDMNARGWFSGDLHGHRRREEMPQLLLAEDLNVGTCITTQWRDDPAETLRVPPPESEGWLSVVDERHAFSQRDAEVERLGEGMGALVAVGLREQIAFDCERWYPPDSRFADIAHAAGGHVDAEKGFWDAVPVLAALGKLDSVGVVCNHFARSGTDLGLGPWGARLPGDARIDTSEALARWMATLYYRLLDCGFRLPVSGGSASGIMPNPLGYDRTYVRVDGDFSYPAWLGELRGGRSFATNGPMLTLTADHQDVGDEIPVTGGETLLVRARAESLEPVVRAELVSNGEVVAQALGTDGQTATVLEHAMTAAEPGWIAARAFAGREPNVRFAHTSPIYLSSGVEPRRRAADARLLADWVGDSLARADRATKGSASDRRDALLRPLRQAAAVYAGLAQR